VTGKLTPSRPLSGARASRDRWLVSYADMTTLLLACFASLYAASLTRPLEASGPGMFEHAGSKPVVVTSPAPVDPVTDAVRAQLAEIVRTHSDLSSMDLGADARGLVLSLPEAGSFASGRAEPSAEAARVLDAVGRVLAHVPNAIRVEGHTDDLPMRSGAFASNWELSTARATRVVEWLIDRAGVPASQLAAAGYAEFRPRVPNDSPENRARNRRVDIVVLSAASAREEPAGGIGR
jgi:chemotaxis protein MotB